MWTQAADFSTCIPGEQLRRVPPRYACQSESVEGRRKLARVPRKFMPRLHALEADLTGLGEAGLQRRLCAQLPHIVVGPDDGIRAQTNAHGSVIIRPQLTSNSVALATGSDCSTIRDLRHQNGPPMPSRCGARSGVGLDDEDRRTVGLARRGQGA